jgi:hypothetical protein
VKPITFTPQELRKKVESLYSKHTKREKESRFREFREKEQIFESMQIREGERRLSTIVSSDKRSDRRSGSDRSLEVDLSSGKGVSGKGLSEAAIQVE